MGSLLSMDANNNFKRLYANISEWDKDEELLDYLVNKVKLKIK